MTTIVTVTAQVIVVRAQVTLIISGNLSFLNWLTLVPPILCLDDAFLAPLFPKATTDVVRYSWLGVFAHVCMCVRVCALMLSGNFDKQAFLRGYARLFEAK
jgi:hypothetical protein